MGCQWKQEEEEAMMSLWQSQVECRWEDFRRNPLSVFLQFLEGRCWCKERKVHILAQEAPPPQLPSWSAMKDELLLICSYLGVFIKWQIRKKINL